MIKTVFQNAIAKGTVTPFLPAVIYHRMRKGHPGLAPTATLGMPTRGDRPNSTRMPDLRVLIVLSVVSAVAALLLVAASASADTQSFANPAPITVPGSGTGGPASPYPSSVDVRGITGPITDVNVTLHRVSHTRPRDIRVILESPSGDTVSFMSENCGEDDLELSTFIFDQQAANPMPIGSTCPNFVYRPNPASGHGLDLPAPGGGGAFHGTSLNDFNGENPHGVWRLWVGDVDGGEDTGAINSGWTLTITTGAVDTEIPGTGTSGPASPYPATRTVSGHAGVISDLNVTIDAIWHERPDDLDMLLVGPEGQEVVLMSDACGSYGVNAYGWVWDDEAPALMPDGDGTNVCGTRFHRPADYDAGEIWPAPAPPQPYSASLSAFDGTDPNGEWKLFVNDDSSGATGFFTNRFQLQINTKPTITPLSPLRKTRTTRPLISAKVSDAQTELSQANMTLFVDNRPTTAFSYSQSTDTLTYRSTKLKANKRHTVRIVANDGVTEATRSWSFKVLGRR